MKLNDLDLNKLHVFLAVAEAGGVTPAAHVLGRTRSAVSQSVAALEGALGIRLFDRVGKRLVLTRPGRVLRERVRESHGALQRTLGELVDEGGEVRGLVRIGLFLGFPRVRFAGLLSRFAAAHPRASARLVFAPQDDLTRRLAAHRLDYTFSFEPPRDRTARIASTRLFAQKLVLVSGKTFFRRGFDPTELGATPVIDYYQSDPLVERWLAHHVGDARPAVEVRVWAATTDMVLELILDGTGVGVVPDSVAAPYVARRRLKVLTTRRDELVDWIWMNEPRDAYRDATLAAFRAAALAELHGA
jgi:DNA-binding transcriptional LysR family regulator